ncbi:DNA methylase N-4 [Novosphingobium sp. Gsoil 351]|nr:DNA methylase N-4 [Novosphingobium sp. Gsoil 351]
MLEHKLGPIHYQSLESLIPYAGNPRKHPEKQIVKLMASLTQFGFAMPALIDEGGVIVAGEAVVEAARRLGVGEVPVLVAGHWSKAQVRAYRLADNRLAELATWDEQQLAIELDAIIAIDEAPVEILGWDTAEIDLILDAPAYQEHTCDPADEIVEPPSIPVSSLGDLWLMGPHRLLCGSSLDGQNWVRLMDGQTGAMVFTDAPFNLPVNGHVSGLGRVKHAEFAMASGEMSAGEFTVFLATSIGHMAGVLKDGGVLTLAMDWRHSPEILAAMESNNLTLLNLCVWNKTNGGMGSLYRSKHELFWIAKKGTAKHTNNVELGRYGRYRTNVWDYPGVNTFGKNRLAELAEHPTKKPAALAADAIRDVTNPNEIVIDGFMGSGTTILAAQRTRRVGYGIEIDPRYIDVAIRRWEKMTGQKATLVDTGETFDAVAERRRSPSVDGTLPGAGDGA